MSKIKFLFLLSAFSTLFSTINHRALASDELSTPLHSSPFLSEHTSDIEELTDLFGNMHITPNYFLERMQDDKRVVQYVNETVYFKLNDKDPKKFSSQMGDLSSKDKYKNHMRAGVYRHTQQSVQRRLLRCKDLHIDEQENSNLFVDWGSNKAAKKYADTFLRKSEKKNGHSEPQFIEDFNAAWKKDSSKVLGQLLSENLDDNDVFLGAGIELYGAFDSCDECLKDLVDFRKSHSEGQSSFSSAVSVWIDQKRMKREKDYFTENFCLMNHSFYPYKEAQYFSNGLPLEYSYSFTSGKRSDSFKSTVTLEADSILMQKDTAQYTPLGIYSHIHFLSDKQAKYKNNTFVF